jgi:hypothetical protein
MEARRPDRPHRHDRAQEGKGRQDTAYHHKKPNTGPETSRAKSGPFPNTTRASPCVVPDLYERAGSSPFCLIRALPTMTRLAWAD